MLGIDHDYHANATVKGPEHFALSNTTRLSQPTEYWWHDETVQIYACP